MGVSNDFPMSEKPLLLFGTQELPARQKTFARNRNLSLLIEFITLLADTACTRGSFSRIFYLLFFTSYHCRDHDIAHCRQEDPCRENYYS